jgi:hypothetical protein
MAKTATAAFAQTPKIAAAVAATAYTGLDGDTPSNTVELLTAGTEGAIVTSIWAMPRATVTATALALWVSTDSGTTKRLIDSELMAAHTVATTTAIPETKFSNYSETAPLRLPASAKLYVGIGVTLASGIVFKAEYTDY